MNQAVKESITKSLQSSTADVPPSAHSPTNTHHGDSLDVEHLHLDDHITNTTNIFHNPPVPVLYEQALAFETGSAITSTGALITRSGAKTGRCPKDKRIVQESSSEGDIWWGPVNIPLDDLSFMINRERAIDYLNTQDKLFVIDGFAGWDPKYRIKVRVICARAYHALFMNNMLIRPTKEELKDFGEPDYTIYNAGQFPANRFTKGMSSATSVSIDFAKREMIILGTQYAGEMKKGVLTIMMYLMPKRGVLPLHSSCNEGKKGDVTLFFGLSGTGKTTLSADPQRYLIGDDEHVWTDEGYTAKVAGTEVGVTEPTAAFSSCYGEPFIVWHPTKYAEMLAEKLRTHQATAWLVNTGWTGGSYGIGSRIRLAYTRAIIDAIHSGELAKQATTKMDVFGLHVPNACPNVPSDILMPSSTWVDKSKYQATVTKLATLFIENFKNSRRDGLELTNN
ncbi:phosphoenolpyruvate carboxykinase [Cavenderia fasciculata]|uniref:phosphoenolpyruvate carboxykinase (ATP) n=1 Tax=Cavenderia fasciculata TaxID=261658 RepID=F4PPN2_CACFS|nr:phosphoenolpyruvate carboxykinase [Cavenderia fasciculata]EGG22345.1 phosphoenolpyruvate carboxykinase [Cavenderia fasciculata]|eukprot:XP_004360196.1 phosphoenolpyruvate carboxykinase [Cavenderia fasciculata]